MSEDEEKRRSDEEFWDRLKAAGYHTFDIYTPPLLISHGINAGIHAHPFHLANLRMAERDPEPWQQPGERMELSEYYAKEIARKNREHEESMWQKLRQAGIHRLDK